MLDQVHRVKCDLVQILPTPRPNRRWTRSRPWSVFSKYLSISKRGWDPKETWALVTFLVYSFALHGGVLKPFRRPRFFHGFCVLAFLCVLITYFGVNFLLGGMHAYA